MYDVTPYVAYHPGGEKEMMRGAGRDATKLFGITISSISAIIIIHAVK